MSSETGDAEDAVEEELEEEGDATIGSALAPNASSGGAEGSIVVFRST